MVKLAILFAAGLAALTGFASAKNCKNGLNYCGYGLLRKGNYYQDIVNELNVVGQPTDEYHVNQSLFRCGGNGGIAFISYCNECHDGGSGKSDYC